MVKAGALVHTAISVLGTKDALVSNTGNTSPVAVAPDVRVSEIAGRSSEIAGFSERMRFSEGAGFSDMDRTEAATVAEVKKAAKNRKAFRAPADSARDMFAPHWLMRRRIVA